MAGRLLRSPDSMTHVWSDGTMTSFQPGRTYEESDLRDGPAAERKAFIEEALAKGLLEELPREPAEQTSGGRRARGGQ